MALSKRLRETLCKKMNVKERRLRDIVIEKSTDSGITDRDVSMLLIAHEKGIDVSKPRFEVPREKIDALQEYLKQNKMSVQTQVLQVPKRRKLKGKNTQLQIKYLLKFKGRYPEIFYNRLQDEINISYSNSRLPNATYMLSRKLIENLLYNLLENKFGGRKINIYYDTSNRRAHDFSILLRNLKENKSSFDVDLHGMIEKFLKLAHPFRRDVNSKVHNVMDYLETMKQVRDAKIDEMVQILLKLIDRSKNQPKS